MPTRMCSHPKCGAHVLRGYCPEHSAMGRTVNRAWYDTKRWKLARNRQLFDHPLCEHCARVAEHSLCRSCHSKTHAGGG
jgi:hypothetical protein